MRRSGALGGVYRYSAEPQRLAAWYAEHLGIDAGGDTPGQPFRILSADSERLDGTSAVSFTVPELNDTVKVLRGQGVEVDGPHYDAGGDYATLSDPDGNLISLRQASSSAPQEQPYIYLLDSEGSEEWDAAEEPQKNRHRLPKSVPIALAIVVAVAVVFTYVIDPADGSSEHAAPDTAASDTTTVRTTTRPAPSSAQSAVTTTVRNVQLGHPMLGIQGDWELLAQGSNEVIRIQPADGRITRITIPSLEVSGPVSLIAWPDRAYVRSMGGESGYIVHDDGSTTEVSGRFVPGSVYPGLEPGQLWAPVGRDTGSAGSTYRLIEATGEPVRSHVPQRPVGSWPIGSDANGHLLARIGGDVYLAKRHATKRVTRGTLLATGPTKFLVLECDRNADCSPVVIDRRTGNRRTLDIDIGQRVPSIRGGKISADGSIAAITRRGPDARRSTMLIELATGSVSRLPELNENANGYQGGSALSPNGRWLFYASSDGTLSAVDTNSLRVHKITADLPPINQLAITTQ